MRPSSAAMCNSLTILIALLSCAALLPAQSAPQFHPPPSAGQAINLAARAATEERPNRATLSPFDILNDTQGVDFSRYLQGVFAKVRQNWYQHVPESEQMKKGEVAIAFSVLKDGQLTDMKLDSSSGDVSLERAAWEGITDSSPLPPLPADFHGDHVVLRLRFLYNLTSAKSTDTSSGGHDSSAHAVLIHTVADSKPPTYPKGALDAKIEGLVRLEGMVSTKGEIKNLKIIEGDKNLAAAALDAISKWRFEPARKNGKLIEEPARINIVFRLDGEQVCARLVSPEACCDGSEPSSSNK
jgi:TonB family protein